MISTRLWLMNEWEYFRANLSCFSIIYEYVFDLLLAIRNFNANSKQIKATLMFSDEMIVNVEKICVVSPHFQMSKNRNCKISNVVATFSLIKEFNSTFFFFFISIFIPTWIYNISFIFVIEKIPDEMHKISLFNTQLIFIIISYPSGLFHDDNSLLTFYTK